MQPLRVLLLLSCTLVPSLASHGGCDSSSNTFDYWLMVMQWPPTYNHAINHWTIHGLWPSRVGDDADSYPCSCAYKPFDKSSLASIEQELDYFWPSLFGTNSKFWSHEWGKHGTCSNITSELGYFESTLDIRKSHDPLPALAKAGINPRKDSPHSYDSISKALESAFGYAPLLGCENSHGEQMLKEIGLCFDTPDAKGIAKCDPSVRRIRDEVNDCNPDKVIYFPAPAAVGEWGSVE